MQRQGRRARVLVKAFRGGVEERLFVRSGIVRRLPFSAATKQRLWLWMVSRTYGRSNPVNVPAGQKSWDQAGRSHLQQLLSSDERIAFPKVDHPALSIILVFYNKAHLSVLGLESIAANADVAYEVVIVDNGSTDDTGRLLERIDGAKIVRNSTNSGFAEACMQAAEQAQGEHLCFLNNDVLLQPNALSAATLNFEDTRVGVVGGKILLANGDLQEAGSVIWADGTAVGYGRGDNPGRPQYQFRRPVDFCSGVFLFTRRRLFLEVGGFNPLYSPAYYEDADYCMKVWKEGLQVIYEPRAILRHYESASSNGSEAAKGLMAINHRKFVGKWEAVLPRHLPNSGSNMQRARISVNSPGARILYLDDRVPHRHLGAGYPRSNDILSCLAKQGHHVTCATLTYPLSEDGYSDIPRDVELLDGIFDRARLFRDYLPNSDVVWVSRPHNMEGFLTQTTPGGALRKARLIYDAEAIFAQRDQLRAQIDGHEMSPAEVSRGMEHEVSLAKAADAVVVVSERDRQVMLVGVDDVHIISYRLDPKPTPNGFDERRGFLFVGAMHGADNPNADAMRYFCGTIWPAVRRATGADLVIAGYGSDVALSELKAEGVRVLGQQKELTELYNQARVFVVPTRYSAGIPYKAHEAAANGVPLVVSSLIAEQLAWKDQEDCLVASSPTAFAEACCRLYTDAQLWSRVRSNALQRIASDFNESTLASAISSLLGEAAVVIQSPESPVSRGL
jgi:GT2 family glycosyltransferase/glycosyltransferase involved in cell wall biosynthesis